MDTDRAGETAMVRGRKEKPKSAPQKRGPKRQEASGVEGGGYVSVGIKFPAEIYRLLKLISANRLGEQQYSGRSSLSAIVSEMVAAHIPEMRKEAAEYLKREGADLGVTRSR